MDGIDDFHEMQSEVSDLYGGRDDVALDSAELENELDAMIQAEPMPEDPSFGALPGGNRDTDTAGFMVTAASVLGSGGSDTQQGGSTLPTEDVNMGNERAALLDHMGMQ